MFEKSTSDARQEPAEKPKHDGLIKCLNCLNMWTPDETQETA